MIPAIICAGETGRAVVFGYVEKLPEPNETISIKNARMVLRWSGECGGLFGLATNGPKGDTRITAEVQETTCTARQALTVSSQSEADIKTWPAWK